MRNPSSLEDQAFLVWHLSLKAREFPCTITQKDIDALEALEFVGVNHKIRALAAETLGEIIVTHPTKEFCFGP